MDTLLFLPNIINPDLIKKLNIPLKFIAFAFVHGKMYKKDKSGLLVQSYKSPRGNSVVYGAIFLCERFDYYNRVIDSMMGCSLSSLKVNHKYDVMHRIKSTATVISFPDLKALVYLKYKEVMQVEVQMYVANSKHENYSVLARKTNRIMDGILVDDFIKLYKGVVL